MIGGVQEQLWVHEQSSHVSESYSLLVSFSLMGVINLAVIGRGMMCYGVSF